jgi:hypothetical protein
LAYSAAEVALILRCLRCTRRFSPVPGRYGVVGEVHIALIDVGIKL